MYQHVETAEQFPFMQGKAWRQNHVLRARRLLGRLTPEYQAQFVVGLEELPPRDALRLLEERIARLDADRIARLPFYPDPRECDVRAVRSQVKTARQRLARSAGLLPEAPLTEAFEEAIAAIDDALIEIDRLLRRYTPA